MENLMVSNGNMDSEGDGSLQADIGVEENENYNVDILEDLDSYWEDINDRLTVSRTVSDSIIRGMVSGVEQLAADEIAQKELEVAKLRETLHLYHVGAEENDFLSSPSMQSEVCSSFSEIAVEHDRLRESVASLKNAAKEQFETLRNELDDIKESSSLHRTGSGPKSVRLAGGTFLEDISKKWTGVEKTCDTMKKTLETAFKRMDDMVYLSKESLLLSQQEREFEKEIEDMVIKNSMRSFKKDLDDKFLGKSAQTFGNEGLIWAEKIHEISGLCLELENVTKLLSDPELGHSRFLENVEDRNNRRMDNLHRTGKHVSSASLWEGNGESEISIPKNYDATLMGTTMEKVVHYFKTKMNEMKRDHDYRIHEMTDEYFTLKREYLNLNMKERGHSLTLKRDKDFDIARKKIPDVILKLEKILVENEKLPISSNKAENLGSLKDRIDSLLSDNRQLRGLLVEMKKENNDLTSQLSNLVERMSRQSQDEAILTQKMGSLEGDLEDAHIEAYISNNVYHCLLRGWMVQFTCMTEESELEKDMLREVYDIMLRNVSSAASPSCNCNSYDSYIESLIMQELSIFIYREALKESEERLTNLNMKYINEHKIRVSLETDILERDRAFEFEVAEKKKLKEDCMFLEAVVEQKENQLQKVETALAKETELFKLALQDLEKMRHHATNQRNTILENSKGSSLMKSKLVEAEERVRLFEGEIHELEQKLQLATEELRKMDAEKRMLLDVDCEKQHELSMFGVKEKEQWKQMDLMVGVVETLLKAMAVFESRVAGKVRGRESRLESLCCQLNSLEKNAKTLRAFGLKYQQKFERRCSDLQKAEAEVDLLADEVDSLMGLLEKIYIALDHYSPVLKHYSGITEILKLVSRELSGQSSRRV